MTKTVEGKHEVEWFFSISSEGEDQQRGLVMDAKRLLTLWCLITVEHITGLIAGLGHKGTPLG